MTVYGIKNCNTVKTATAWLKGRGIEFEFHDYKARGISLEKLKSWTKQVGWERLLNKRGTTWRQLGEEVQASITGEEAALSLMMEKPSVIRRPLLEEDGSVIALGFDEEVYTRLFLRR